MDSVFEAFRLLISTANADADAGTLIYLSILIFARLFTFTMFVPVLGFAIRDIVARLGFATAMTLFVVSYIPTGSIGAEILGGPLFFLLLVKESAIGLATGFIFGLFLEAIRSAGDLVQHQLNPYAGSGVEHGPLMGLSRLKWFLVTVLFFSSNAHVLLINSIVEGFRLFPVGVFPALTDNTINTVAFIATTSAGFFVIAIGIALPLILVILAAELIFALLQRSMPYLNGFLIGLSLKTVVMIFVMAILLRFFVRRFEEVIQESINSLEAFMKVLG